MPMNDKTNRTELLLMARLLSDAGKALFELGRHCNNGKPTGYGGMAPNWLKLAEWMRVQAAWMKNKADELKGIKG